ncbi:MAG: mRNA surveillance protein pelota [Candidatus Altiarchaeota archaeon]|nr:mRNA surveillance protein pelota [Candidatus Altiarchaeota archaeon]
MKVLKRDLKQGEIVVKTENLDDLWYLGQIVREGDIVKGRTERRIKGKDDKLRGDEGRRESVFLGVKVEKAELDKNANRLRVLGKIVEGPDDMISFGSHHTFEVDDCTSLGIIKESWSESEFQYIRDAEQSAKRAKMMICVIGDGEATVALVRESRIDYVDTKGNIGGKYAPGREERKSEFYKELEELLSAQVKKENVERIILAGPGFEKKNFHEYLTGKNPDIARNASVADIGSEGRTGVNEVLKGGIADKVESETRIAREARLMEKLLLEISKNGLAAYGFEEAKNAVVAGAVETLLISDEYFRENREVMEKLIKIAKNARGEFHILNSDYEPGGKLNGLGGVAALLRYKITQ